MTRSTILAGSLALSAIVTVVLVHRTDAQDGPRPIPANLTSYLVPFRQLYDLETSFPRWPLPAGERAYASFDGARIKQDVDAITAISRRSRESGAQYWGRIAGSPYDAATRKWIGDRFRQLGAADVKEQSFPLPPQWHPVKWTVSSSVNHGPAHEFSSAFPFTNSPGTASGGVELDVAYVGLGRAADFAGRNVRGKAVLIFSTPAPGVRDHSAEWFGALERAKEQGAAAMLVVLGLPGNLTSIMRDPTTVPAFSLGQEDGVYLMDLVDRAGPGAPAKIRMDLDVKMDTGLETATVWATLQGTSDEDIVIIAHHDAFFEGATDNASGMATMLALVEYYAKQPRGEPAGARCDSRPRRRIMRATLPRGGCTISARRSSPGPRSSSTSSTPRPWRCTFRVRISGVRTWSARSDGRSTAAPRWRNCWCRRSTRSA